MAFITGDRRRRVLTEQIATAASGAEAATATASVATAADPATFGPAYEADAFGKLPRITDLVPQRKSMLALAWFLLLVMAGGLVALSVYSPQWTEILSEERIAALNLSATSGLAAWFKTMLLLSAAALCAVIYTVRRHRTDDYQGRYRAWVTAAICWLLLSLANPLALSETLPELGIRFTAWQGWRAGALWWLVPTGLVYGVTLLRMALDMRRAVGSLLLLLMAASVWCAALALELDLLQTELAPTELAQSALTLAGHVLLVASLLTYARLVSLQVSGKIAAVAIERKKKEAAPAKKKRKTKATAETTTKSKTKTGGSTSGSKAVKKSDTSDKEESESETRSTGVWGRKPTQPASTSPSTRTGAAALTLGRTATDDDDEESDSEEGDNDQFGDRQKLSKADRKRLRRERSRESRAA